MFRDGPAVPAPCQKYISGSVLGIARKIHTYVLSTLL